MDAIVNLDIFWIRKMGRVSKNRNAKNAGIKIPNGNLAVLFVQKFAVRSQFLVQKYVKLDVNVNLDIFWIGKMGLVLRNRNAKNVQTPIPCGRTVPVLVQKFVATKKTKFAMQCADLDANASLDTF